MPRLFVALLLLCLSALSSTACHPPAEPRGSAEQRVDERVAVGFAAARAALELADAAELAYLRDANDRRIWSGEDDPRFLAAMSRSAKLQAIRSALELVRQRIVSAEPADLRSLLVDLVAVQQLAEQAGVPGADRASKPIALMKEVLQ